MTTICRRIYKKGETECYDASTPIGHLTFSGKCPEVFALKYAETILKCSDCLKYARWNNHQMGICSYHGRETGCQKGFNNYAEELDDESSADRPSVFNTYLKNDWNLKRIGNVSQFDTIGMMVDELIVYLNEKFGDEKTDDIIGLADYLRSLNHNPREAIFRIRDLMYIPEEQLYDRNWAYLWGAQTHSRKFQSLVDDQRYSPFSSGSLDYSSDGQEAREKAEEEEQEEGEDNKNIITPWVDDQTANRLCHARKLIEYHFGCRVNTPSPVTSDDDADEFDDPELVCEMI